MKLSPILNEILFSILRVLSIWRASGDVRLDYSNPALASNPTTNPKPNPKPNSTPNTTPTQVTLASMPRIWHALCGAGCHITRVSLELPFRLRIQVKSGKQASKFETVYITVRA